MTTAAGQSEIVSLDAATLVEAIRRRRLSCVEVMNAFLDQIDRLNPTVNAIVALRDRESLIAEAEAKDLALERGAAPGGLYGLPLAVKDLQPVMGLRATSGSPILRDFIAPKDGLMVSRMRAAGAIFVGKTNTPEFGLGSHTYNPVFGATGNAYDATRSSGGSSGGAAVALALRMAPLADGSDFGGSLRNPAGWNNVFGFRPSAGVVPEEARDVWAPTMSVSGPMARTASDLALLLSVQAGRDSRAPLSLPGDGARFSRCSPLDLKGKRIGWLGDFGGFTPCAPGVLEACSQALTVFEDLGCAVEPARPDFPVPDAWAALLTLRAWQVGSGLLEFYRDPLQRALMKPEAVYEVERGLGLSAYDISAASLVRTAWSGAIRRLFDRFDYLALPTAQVFPFDIAMTWPREINGQVMQTYHEWMKANFLIALSGCPALAAPAGFNAEGLPMGVQIVAPVQADDACIAFGLAYDAATRWSERAPPPLLKG